MLALVAHAVGCGPGEGVARDVVEAYVYAVQDRDLDRLYCLSAGAAGSPDLGADAATRRAGFAAWADAEYGAYLAGRDEGFVDWTSSPIPLVRALTLGKGTFFDIERVAPAGEEGAVVDMDVRLAYASIDLSDLSPGTGFYVCETPPGAIEHVRVPRFGGEVTADVLDRVPVRWTLVREDAADGCEAGWKVNTAEVVAGRVTSRTVTWVF